MVLLVLTVSVGASRRAAVKAGGAAGLGVMTLGGGRGGDQQQQPYAQPQQAPALMPPAPGGDFFSSQVASPQQVISPVASGKPDVNSGNVKKIDDDLKKQVEEKGRQAFFDGYNKGFAEGQKAAASAKASKNPKKPMKGEQGKKGATPVKKSVIKLATAPAS